MRLMRLSFAVLAVCFVATLAVPHAHAQVAEVFGGYSYVDADSSVTTTIACPGPPCPVSTVKDRSNLNGWELAGTIKPGTWYGVTADFSGHYGTTLGASNHLQTYLFGPKFSFPGPISPFVHVLVGAAHENIGSSSTALVVPTSRTAFAAAAGAGIDVRVAPFVALRLIQFDYLLTHFNTTNQNQPRISTGVVIRF